MNSDQTIRDLLAAEVHRRLLGEGVPRIQKCLSELSEAEIWYRPNSQSNSVGNLVLHLCGNVRQWILTGLAEYPDTRQRQLEFDEKGPLPTADLLRRLDEVMAEVAAYLQVMPVEKLTQPIVVQGFKETGLTVLVHVVEHFSYHVGQIAYFTKWKKNVDTLFYEDEDLDVTG